MTPKEKAKELVEKFKEQLKTATPNLNRPYYQATQCALIAVDEIIKEQCKSSECKNAIYQDERIDYWQQVKEEINKM